MILDELLIGVGGILLGLVQMHYTITILHGLSTQEKMLDTGRQQRGALRMFRLLTAGFFLLAVGGLAALVGVWLVLPWLDTASRVVAGISLVTLAVFLRTMAGFVADGRR